MRIHYLQHAAFETPGSMLDWAARHGHTWSYTYLYEWNPKFPSPADFDWLLVLGGAMGVHDEAQYPWLLPEKQLISQAIAAGKVVLGICLGAQLLAEALGATVYHNPDLEIGFWPLEPTAAALANPLFRHLTQPLTVLHWHGDTFTLPPGAELLASSLACRHQAFAYEQRVIGLQFHPELTPVILDQMLLHDGHELVPGPWVQPAATLRQRVAELAAGQAFLFELLDHLAARLALR